MDKFDSSLIFNKEMLSQQIAQVLAVNDKKDLISAKAKLFSEFYAVKFANSLMVELLEKAKNARENNVISLTKQTIIQSEIQRIINKNLSASNLANQLFNYYKTQVKEIEDLTYLNNELKLIETQINEVNGLSFTSEDIKSKLNELHNQVNKTYSDNVTVSFLNSIKNTLNENLRNILKDDLKNLIQLMNEKITLVKNLHNPLNSIVVDEAVKLNEASEKMVVDFNPISSVELIKQIKIYDLKLQNLINANKQTKAEKDSDFTDDYLKIVFSDNNDNYVPTDKEQKRIDLYNQYKADLDKIRGEINSGSGNAQLAVDIANLQTKLNNLSDTGNDFRKLSLLDKQASDTIATKQESLNSIALQPYINNLQKVRDQLDSLYSNVNATKEQILDAQKALSKALKELNEADTKILLEQKIAQLKNEIEANYQGDLTSPGALALLKNYNDLLQEAKDTSNEQNSNASISKANQLIAITPYLFDAEINKKRLLTIIGEKTSAPYSGNKTAKSISRGRDEIKSIDELITRLNNPDNIPNLEAFENAKANLLQRGDEILLAYEQEKIEKINQNIQATKKNTVGGANDNFAKALEKVNAYATVQKSQLNFQKASASATKMEFLEKLANVSGELLDAYNLYNVNPTQTLSDYISNLLLNNELGVGDSNEEIQNKILNLNKAKEVIIAKKEFLDVYLQLKNVLEENKDWKIYTPLKRDINLILQESNAIIFNNDLTIDQINAKKAEFQNKIKLYQIQKQDLLDLFSQAITQVDAKQTSLNADVVALIGSNPNYDFDTYFKKAKEAYAHDKQLDQKVNVDTDDINAYSSKLEIAFNKDIVLNKLKDIKTTATVSNFGSSDLHNKVKSGWDTFNGSVKNNLNLNTLSLEDVLDINKKVNRFSDLFTLQKRITDYLAKNRSQITSQTLSLETLKDAVEQSLPIASDGFTEIDNKYKELLKTYEQEIEIQEIRENIISTLENQDLANGQLGLIKSLENALGATYDSDVTSKLNSYVAATKTSAATSTSREELIKLLHQVNTIRDEVPAIATLAKNVAGARNILDNLTNGSSNLINSYAQKLNAFLTEAKNNYFKLPSNSQPSNLEFYNQLSNKIDFTAKKIFASDALATKLQEIKDILSNNNFNLRSVNGEVGLSKQAEINAYLDSFENTAQNDDYTQESVQKINILTQKATAYKNVISTNLDVLTYANTLANNNDATSANDLEATLLLVWDSVPRATAYANSVLGKVQGNIYNVNDLFDITSASSKNVAEYNALTQQIITEINNQKDYIQARNAYRVTTETKINALRAKDFTPLVHNDLKNDLFNLLNTLESQNNVQNSWTINNQSGDLNVIRSKVNLIENKLDGLKNLAQKAYELNALDNTIISNETLLNNEKTQAQTLISKAKSYFGDTNKMSLTGNDSIENVALELEAQRFKLNLLVKFEEVKNQYNSEAILATSSKNVIKAKLDTFENEYNNNILTPEQLFNKYFRDATDIPNSEPASVKNTLIKYVLENSINLQKEFVRAESFIALEDQNLDSTEVASKIADLRNLINNNQSGVAATLNENQNNEVTKIQLLNTIKDHIQSLISAKKDQLTTQLNANNQIKNFFDSTKNNFAVNGVAPSYVDNFEAKGINDLTTAISNKDDLSYSQVNVYLANAKSVANLQIFDLYTKATNTVENIQTTVADYVNDFAPSKTNVLAGSELGSAEYTPLLTLKNTIDNALGADFNSTENFETKINALVNIINGNYQNIITTFVNAIKAHFEEKFAPAPQQGQSGFYVKLISTLNALKQNVTGQNVNLFKYNQIESLENQYDAFKNQFGLLNNLYTALTSKTDSGSIANFATLLNTFNQSFLNLVNSIKDAVTNALAKNPLEEVFADLFETIRYNVSSSDTDTIKNAFNTFKQGILTTLNTVTTANFDFTTLNKTNSLDSTLSTLLNKITEYNNWIKEDNNKQMLLDSLNNDPNEQNPLTPIEAGLDGTFDHKYKVAIAKDEITRKEFIKRFEALTNNAQNNLVQIDNNDAFLDMFQQFAYTKKDVLNASDLKSIYSPIKFKVYIKKYDQNGWFNVVAPTASEVDRQSLKAKIVYAYESNATDIGQLEVEKEVVLTFKTLDTVKITNGTTSIFINSQNQGALQSKLEVLDVDEAGWNITQVANMQDASYNTVKQEVITKVYNKLKAAVFALNDNNSTINQSGIITPNNSYLASLRTATDANLANLNYTTTGQNNRLSAFLDKDNRDSTTKYGFDFGNQESVAVTYNISLTTSKEDERLVIFPLDSEKGFTFLQLQGGYLTGFPTYGSGQGQFQPQWYDDILKGSDPGYSNIYNDSATWWNTPNNRIPTGLNVNLYSFNVDYDPIARKVYLYNSWTENTLFVINRYKLRDELNNLKNNNNNNLKASDIAFIDSLLAKLGNAPQNYVPTPSELSRTFEIHSTLYNRIFNNSLSSWLPTSQNIGYGAGPIYPITGGQQTVFRTTPTDPTTAQLRATPARDFNQQANQLVKSSARESLYSAIINKFFFKIR
ncbi:hypothetical protein NPA08_02515 [Mycoplasmopsis citelli]|uniref:hypothetical protein n=1 Tax=Mycoplasmopsis citelli TaxID=171281 RepID=UPI002115333D|nr:hypothetical protein [Mycoplasmopsis citelli]UUD35818.1 hypothetical protein NPA08_02515 [Mycoplasmopsis citelli]